MAKRRKRYTGQFWNDSGDHIYSNLEQGWHDPKSAAKMTGAFLQAACDIECDSWIVFRIPYSNETAFTRTLNRRISGTPAGYFVIRAKADVESGEESGDITSWYFIYGSSLDAISMKAERYSSHAPELIDTDRLQQLIRWLFNVKLHPELPGHRLNRWSASQETRQLLTSNRVKHLVDIAREDSSKRFEEAMGGLLFHDRPFIFSRSKYDKLQALRDTGMLTDEELRGVAEHMKVLWKLVDMYQGSPEAGAKLDEETGKFNIRYGDTYIIANRKEKLTKRQLAWEVINRPESSDEESIGGDSGDEESGDNNEAKNDEGNTPRRS